MNLFLPMYTWLDAVASLSEFGDLPREVIRIEPFLNDVSVYVRSESASTIARDYLTRVFGVRFQQDRILLDSLDHGAASLSVSYFVETDPVELHLPLFQYANIESTYGFESKRQLKTLTYAFYSFKGGVGRTTHLLGLLEAGSKVDTNLKCLVVDFDLEAPGITWLAQADGLAIPSLSVIDILALWHRRNNFDDDPIELFADRIREQTFAIQFDDRAASHFYVPAFRYPRQLLSGFVTPEVIVRSPGQRWAIADIFSDIAASLGADIVLFDLRAGTNELSAPVLFDNRVERVIVTTDGEQSVAGTELTLKTCQERGITRGASIIFSFRRESANFELYRENDLRLLQTNELLSDNLADSPITNSQFNSELIAVSSLSDLFHKISSGSLGGEIASLAERLFPTNMVKPALNTDIQYLRRTLAEEANRYEYAETGAASSFLTTTQLRALAQSASTNSPAAVVLGAKGSGKTYTYLQLAQRKTWSAFVDETLGKSRGQSKNNFIWPLLQSITLQVPAIAIARDAAASTATRLGLPTDLKGLDDAREQIYTLAARPASVVEWRDRWLQALAISLELRDETDPITAIVAFLRQRNCQLTVIIDGLEDIFQNAATSENEQNAIRALLQSVINRIREVANSPLGIIVFSRADIARSSIIQNFGQFAKPYESFELRWDREQALRLVYWLGLAAQVLPINDARPEDLSEDALRAVLKPLWGEKLGTELAKEARTADWVLAALSDFNGRIQARDLMRLIQSSAKESATAASAFPDRLLTPASIRHAVETCSLKKIDEIGQEIPSLKPIFEQFRNRTVRVIPMDISEAELSRENIRFLESNGILLEDNKQYYMPEIFRLGLDYKLDRGARPKVLTLARRATRR